MADLEMRKCERIEKNSKVDYNFEYLYGHCVSFNLHGHEWFADWIVYVFRWPLWVVISNLSVFRIIRMKSSEIKKGFCCAKSSKSLFHIAMQHHSLIRIKLSKACCKIFFQTTQHMFFYQCTNENRSICCTTSYVPIQPYRAVSHAFQYALLASIYSPPSPRQEVSISTFGGWGPSPPSNHRSVSINKMILKPTKKKRKRGKRRERGRKNRVMVFDSPEITSY